MSLRMPTPLQMVAALAILFLTAVVLFPVFVHPRECARCGVSCASNMKQLGLALEQYAQDNDYMMPNIYVRSPSNTWRSLIFPYAKAQGIYQCPDRHQDDHDENPIGVDGFSQNYAANYTGNYSRKQSDRGWGAFAGPGSQPIALADVPDSANLITLMEAAYNPFPDYNIDNARNFSPASRRFWAGHHGRSSYLFLDGHVKWLRPLATYQKANGRVVKNLWYRDGMQPLSANGVAVLQDAQARFRP
ncbi:MAG: DUF1559 domain-containing protein [Armatimonadetes bacterium]|nr:DUF1559 domain-containing protein [Armatimonadota bacterium]